jgi:hypothetical protein
MSVLGHIGYGVEKKLITAIVMSGHGLELMTREDHPGVLSVTHHHARGTDRRGQRPGSLVWIERDVVTALVEADHADPVFELLFEAGNLDPMMPHQGVVFMEGRSASRPSDDAVRRGLRGGFDTACRSAGSSAAGVLDYPVRNAQTAWTGSECGNRCA